MKTIRCQGRFSVTWWKSDSSGKRIEKKRERRKKKETKREEKTGIEVEKRKSQSYLTFSSKIISRRVARGWKTAGSKGERARTEGARTSKREWKKRAKKAKEGARKRMEREGGREKKVKEKKRREQKAGNCSREESSDSTSVHNVSREKREGKRERKRERRKEAKQRGPIKAESDLNLSKDWCTRNLVINE